jgi:hypothetical protein
VRTPCVGPTKSSVHCATHSICRRSGFRNRTSPASGGFMHSLYLQTNSLASTSD